MTRIADILARMREQPAAVRFSELRRVCETYFGPLKQGSTRHLVTRAIEEGVSLNRLVSAKLATEGAVTVVIWTPRGGASHVISGVQAAPRHPPLCAHRVLPDRNRANAGVGRADHGSDL